MVILYRHNLGGQKSLNRVSVKRSRIMSSKEKSTRPHKISVTGT